LKKHEVLSFLMDTFSKNEGATLSKYSPHKDMVLSCRFKNQNCTPVLLIFWLMVAYKEPVKRDK
jgi:hypothetical protein